MNNSKSKEGRQEKVGGVKLRDGSALEHDTDRETGAEQTIVGRTHKGWRMTDYRREWQSYIRRAGGDEGGQD